MEAGRARLETREVPRFTAAHDRLWRQDEAHFPVAVVRDASYLNWKYVDQPGQSVVRLELAGDDGVRAVAIVSISDADATYRYRRAWLTDLVVRPDDPDLVWSVFEAVRVASLRLGADLLIFDVISDLFVKNALAFGFARREAVSFGPPWARSCLAMFIVVTCMSSLTVKFLFRIA